MNMIVKEGRESDIRVLCEELLVEILCRLGSIKYATQCKSVCKLWCSLVSTPNSYWLHRWGLLNPKTESVSLFAQYRGAIKHRKKHTALYLNLKFLPCFSRKNPVHVLGSHKDLLLCSPNCNDHSCYYICNPWTKHWTALPPPPPIPTKETHTRREFIVDECGNGGLKFTVVRILRYPLRVSVSIFSSDGGWREMDDGGGDGWREMFQTHKGRLIWLMRKENSGEVFRLYSWNLDSNYPRLPCFPGYTRTADNSVAWVSSIGGRLRMAHALHKKLFVWQYDDGQIKKWHMLRELNFSRLGFSVRTQAMAFHPHDGDILYMVVKILSNDRKWSSHIYMCNLKTKRLVLTQELPQRVSDVKLFPLVKNCWPTPVPRLQPQLDVRVSKTPSKITSFLMSRFVPCFGKSSSGCDI